MANYQYAADLVDDILFRANEATDGTSDFNAVALQYLNRAYYSLCGGGSELVPDVHEIWWWLRTTAPGALLLLPIIDYGTVSVANGSATATLSNTPKIGGANVDVDYWFFKVDDHADVFRVSAHTSGATALTLDQVYTGNDDTTATYQLFKTDYTLATDFMYMAGPMHVFQDEGCFVDACDESELRIEFPLHHVGSGVPQRFAMVGEKTVRFSHAGGVEEDYDGTGNDVDYIRVEYQYVALPTALTDANVEPSVPLQHRKILADWGLYLLLLDKDDSKAGDALKMAQSGLLAMAHEQRARMARMSQGRIGKIYPRESTSRGYLKTTQGLMISTW